MKIAMKSRPFYNGLPATYRELVAMHAPRPIRTEAEFDAATALVQKMAGHNLTKDQDDYLDVMTTLVQAYDQQHHALDHKKMSPLEAIQFLMHENAMTASDLGRLIGDRTLGSKILRGERELSKAHILALAERFAVNPSLFLAPEITNGRRTRAAKSTRTKFPKPASGKYRGFETKRSRTP